MAIAPTLIELPYCTTCNSDRFLLYEDFVPARPQTSGSTIPIGVNYICTRCEQYSGHAVPKGWFPPGWFWYN